MRFPLQPIKDGRFVPNRIVRWLLDTYTDMNQVAGHCVHANISDEEQEQFAQLIGYSVHGFGELSYVSNETYEAAIRIDEEGEDELAARVTVLEAELAAARAATRDLAVALFNIHPDDLQP